MLGDELRNAAKRDWATNDTEQYVERVIEVLRVRDEAKSPCPVAAMYTPGKGWHFWARDLPDCEAVVDAECCGGVLLEFSVEVPTLRGPPVFLFWRGVVIRDTYETRLL